MVNSGWVLDLFYERLGVEYERKRVVRMLLAWASETIETPFTETEKMPGEADLERDARSSILACWVWVAYETPKWRYWVGSWVMSLEFRVEVWTKYINLGVISLEMIFKAVKLGEIIKRVGVDRKEEGPRTEPRAGPDCLYQKHFCNCQGLYKENQCHQPTYRSSSCLVKQWRELNNWLNTE